MFIMYNIPFDMPGALTCLSEIVKYGLLTVAVACKETSKYQNREDEKQPEAPCWIIH